MAHIIEQSSHKSHCTVCNTLEVMSVVFVHRLTSTNDVMRGHRTSTTTSSHWLTKTLATFKPGINVTTAFLHSWMSTTNASPNNFGSTTTVFVSPLMMSFCFVSSSRRFSQRAFASLNALLVALSCASASDFGPLSVPREREDACLSRASSSSTRWTSSFAMASHFAW